MNAIAARASRTAAASVPAPMATTGALTLVLSSVFEMPSVGVAFGVVILSVAIVTDRPGPNVVVGGVSVVAMVSVVVGVAGDNDCSSGDGESGRTMSGEVTSEDVTSDDVRGEDVTSEDVRDEDVMATDGVGVGTSSHMTPASCEWLHSLSPQPDRPHSTSLLSLPRQPTSSIQTTPTPSLNALSPSNDMAPR